MQKAKNMVPFNSLYKVDEILIKVFEPEVRKEELSSLFAENKSRVSQLLKKCVVSSESRTTQIHFRDTIVVDTKCKKLISIFLYVKKNDARFKTLYCKLMPHFLSAHKKS